jgi:thioredoxin reductase
MKSDSKGLNLFLWMMEKVATPLLGTSMLRETQKEIEKAGFTVLKSQNKVFDILRLIIATKV